MVKVEVDIPEEVEKAILESPEARIATKVAANLLEASLANLREKVIDTQTMTLEQWIAKTTEGIARMRAEAP